MILPLNLNITMFVGHQMGAFPARRGSQEDPWGRLQEEVRPEGANQGGPENMLSLIFLQYSVGIVKYCLIFFDNYSYCINQGGPKAVQEVHDNEILGLVCHHSEDQVYKHNQSNQSIIQKTRFTNAINQSIKHTEDHSSSTTYYLLQK